MFVIVRIKYMDTCWGTNGWFIMVNSSKLWYVGKGRERCLIVTVITGNGSVNGKSNVHGHGMVRVRVMVMVYNNYSKMKLYLVLHTVL